MTRRSGERPKPKGKKRGATVDEIFERIVEREDGSPLPDNVNLYTGKLDGEKAGFVCAKAEDGEIVPLLLVLDQAARDRLEDLQEIADQDRSGPDDDEDAEEDADEPEDFEP